MSRTITGITALATVALLSLLSPVSANAEAADTQQVASSHAKTTQAAACRTIVITGSHVAVREFPFQNGDPLRHRNTNAKLTSCKLLKGNSSNGYTARCGKAKGGHDWFVVRIPRTVNSIGLITTTGYVPTQCARYSR